MQSRFLAKRRKIRTKPHSWILVGLRYDGRVLLRAPKDVSGPWMVHFGDWKDIGICCYHHIPAARRAYVQSPARYVTDDVCLLSCCTRARPKESLKKTGSRSSKFFVLAREVRRGSMRANSTHGDGKRHIVISPCLLSLASTVA